MFLHCYITKLAFDDSAMFLECCFYNTEKRFILRFIQNVLKNVFQKTFFTRVLLSFNVFHLCFLCYTCSYLQHAVRNVCWFNIMMESRDWITTWCLGGADIADVAVFPHKSQQDGNSASMQREFSMCNVLSIPSVSWSVKRSCFVTVYDAEFHQEFNSLS